MVEKIKFEGIDGVVEVDFKNPHSSHDAAIYAFDEHRPITAIESDNGLLATDVMERLGQHRFTCEELMSTEKKVKGY